MYINAEFHESSRTFYLFKIEEDKNKFRTITFNKKKRNRQQHDFTYKKLSKKLIDKTLDSVLF